MYLVSVLLIVVGTALAGLGVSVVCHDIAPGIAIMLMGLAALAGGIGMLCWYLKNRTELEAPGRVESATEWTAQTSAKTKKVCRVIGKWMLWTAGIILCINVTSRIVEAQKIKEEYVQVMGTVIDVDITSELKYSNAAEGYVESSSYGVLVDYQPQGESYPKSIYEIHSDEFSEGDTVSVMYKKDAVSEAYIAKKDWMTGAYLPVKQYYNVPFVIAVILLVIGFLLYTNSPIVDWYLHGPFFRKNYR